MGTGGSQHETVKWFLGVVPKGDAACGPYGQAVEGEDDPGMEKIVGRAAVVGPVINPVGYIIPGKSLQ